jgi:hypothetical protein
VIDRPTPRLVYVAWLRSLTWTTTPGIAGTLPIIGDWPGGLFISVSTVGGSPDGFAPLRDPVMQTSCWATGGTDLANWRAAHQLAERVLAATYGDVNTTVTLPAGYASARVLSVSALTEPREIPNDPQQAAHVTVDVRLNYITAESEFVT